MSARNDAVHQDKDESSSAPEQRIPTLPRVQSSSQATSTIATFTGTEEPGPSSVAQTIESYQAPMRTVDTGTALNSDGIEEVKYDSPSSPSSFASASGAHPFFGSRMTYSPVPTLTTGSETETDSIRTGSMSHVASLPTGPNRGRTRRTAITTGTTERGGREGGVLQVFAGRLQILTGLLL